MDETSQVLLWGRLLLVLAMSASTLLPGLLSVLLLQKQQLCWANGSEKSLGGSRGTSSVGAPAGSGTWQLDHTSILGIKVLKFLMQRKVPLEPVLR